MAYVFSLKVLLIVVAAIECRYKMDAGFSATWSIHVVYEEYLNYFNQITLIVKAL